MKVPHLRTSIRECCKEILKGLSLIGAYSSLIDYWNSMKGFKRMIGTIEKCKIGVNLNDWGKAMWLF